MNGRGLWTDPSRRRAPLCAVLAAASASLAGPACAQLAPAPALGLGPTGDLHETASALLPGLPRVNTGLAWTYGGSVTLTAGATDSPGGLDRGWQSFLAVTPSFYLNGESSRLSVRLNYTPSLIYYPSSSDQTLLTHSLSASATVTIIPEALYLDAGAYSGISSRFGNTPNLQGTFLSRSETVQTTSIFVSPRYTHTFDGWGTLSLRYAYSKTFQDADNNRNVQFVTTANGVVVPLGYGSIGNLATHTESATFTTGENFGRFNDTISVVASQSEGGSLYAGATTASLSNTASYAVNRWLTVFGTAGWQYLRYPGVGYRLSEPSWSVGATVVPNADSRLTVSYGRTAGSNTVQASAFYSPTARLSLFGNYSVGITTGLGWRQSVLQDSTVGAGGVLIDRTTGAPVVGASFLTSQFTLSRVESLSVGATLVLNRDSFTAGAGHQHYEQLARSTSIFGVTTPAGTTSTTTYAYVGYQRDLNPTTAFQANVSYGVSDVGSQLGTSGSVEYLTGVASLTHTFTPTVSGRLAYTHSERFGEAIRNLPRGFGGAASQNVILASITKSF